MAASNWDEVLFNNQGEAGEYALSNSLGNRLSLHKNWVEVYTPTNFSQSTRIYEGYTEALGFRVHAKRYEEKAGVFVYATSGYGETRQQLAGIACYAFQDELPWLQENRPEILATIPKKFLEPPFQPSFFSRTTFKPERKESWGIVAFDGQAYEEFVLPGEPPSLQDLWEGVTLEVFQAFMEWLKGLDDTQEFLEYVSRVELGAKQFFKKEVVEEDPDQEEDL